jgi:site-specific recombinase XerD
LEGWGWVVQRGVPYGVSSLHLASGVSFLRVEETLFAAMLEGWSMQQTGGRNLRETTVKSVVRVVQRFQTFVDEWPWQWQAAGFDEWMTDLVSVHRLAPSTLRSYQQAVRSFCVYICSEHYGWVQECEERFGTHPVQVCHEWNTTAHLQNYEGLPGRRPLTREELQRLLDHADLEVEVRLASHRKGALTAYRDATLLKVVYAWGLRANEAVHLDVGDFYRNAHAPEFGRFGMLQVRHGKASRGGAPKRRSVVTLRAWAVAAVEDYIDNVWPLMRVEGSNALWLSERGKRLRTRELSERFAQYRDALKLDSGLSPHALRHSYVTHLIEEGFDAEFVQRQVGHAYQSTTAIYTAVSGDFANKMMRRALDKALPQRPEPGEPQ